MKKNMGKTDKLIRLAIVLAIALLSYFNVISGTVGYILLAVAAILLITTFVNFCPIYAIFGASTNKEDEKPSE